MNQLREEHICNHIHLSQYDYLNIAILLDKESSKGVCKMFCKNCGSKVDGMIFCDKCGTKTENIDTEIAIKTATESNTNPIKENIKDLKTLGYILAFLPLLGLITMLIPDDIYSIISPGIIGLNIGLWYVDKAMLKKYGYTGKWTWWGIILIPAYLYFRCKKVDGNFTKLMFNIASMVLVFVVALFI